jgi:hypothetical protein
MGRSEPLAIAAARKSRLPGLLQFHSADIPPRLKRFLRKERPDLLISPFSSASLSKAPRPPFVARNERFWHKQLGFSQELLFSFSEQKERVV